MTRKKRTKITVEAEEIIVIRERGSRYAGWCGACGSQVEMIPPGRAAVIAQVSLRTIYRWVRDERLHAIERPEGSTLICLASLKDR